MLNMIMSIKSARVQNSVTSIILSEKVYENFDSDQMLDLIKIQLQSSNQREKKEEKQIRLVFLFKAFDERISPDLAQQVKQSLLAQQK